jgi:hypothetical protein
MAAREKRGEDRKGKDAVFPNMKSRQSVTLGARSGLLIIGVPK